MSSPWTWVVLLTLSVLWTSPAWGTPPPPEGTIVQADAKASYQWGALAQVLSPDTVPVTAVPQPAGVKDRLVGPKLPDPAIQTSKWWTSLLYKRSTQANVPMNTINPGPLSVWSIPAGVGCRQYYYAFPDPLPPLNQGQPGLHPTTAYTSMAFNEVVAGIGISNQGYGFDQIGGFAAGYGTAPDKYPQTAVVEYSTWAVTFDTLYKDTPFNQGSATAPRLRATVARGSPYMWVEYPDGYPSPQDKPGYDYPTGYANYPFLQVQYTDQERSSTVIYLPPSPDYRTETVKKDDNSNWVQNPINGDKGTKNATGSNANAVAFTVNGRSYAAFGPPGTWWCWFYDPNYRGTVKLLLTYGTYSAATRPYIVIAALPQNVNLADLQQAGKLRDLVGRFKQYAFKRPGNNGSAAKQQGTFFNPTYPDKPGPNYVTGAFTYNLVDLATHKPESDDTTLFALFPHQQAHLKSVQAPDVSTAHPFGSLYDQSYQYTGSRGFAANQKETDPGFYQGKHTGQMRLAEGKGFVLQYILPPVLGPVLPQAKFKGRSDRLQGCLSWDFTYPWGDGRVAGNDSYGWGKLVSAVANNLMLAAAAEWHGKGGVSDLTAYLGDGLGRWLNFDLGKTTKPAPTGFVYDPNWNVMLAFPPGWDGTQQTYGFGTTTYLNDLHFHYGYFIRAAAVYSMYDNNFVKDYGKMVEHLIRTIAADYEDRPNGGDDQAVYPPYRFFDPYSGSSSGAGAQQYADGMNQESSSEAINAWYGMLLWAQLTNNNQMLDRAAYMYASEIDAARRYEFCEDAVVDGQFALISNTFSQLYDDSNQLALFFPQYDKDKFAREAQHIINWLPFGGGALYLGLNPPYAALNYQGMLNQPAEPNHPGANDNWQWYIDLIWMYRSISNAQEAQQKVEAVLFPNAGDTQPPVPPLPTNFLDNGDSTAFLYAWIYTLPNMGQADQTVSSTYPLSAVYSSGGSKVHWAFNPQGSPATVKFSDGATLSVPAHSYASE